MAAPSARLGASAPRRLAKGLAGASLLASLFLLHCGGTPEGASAEHVATTPNPTAGFAAFKAGLEEVAPGSYRVEGDLLVSETELEEAYANGQENAQALTVRKVGATRQLWSKASRADITYCVSDAFKTNKQQVIDAMKKATHAWQTEAGAGLAFRYVPAQDASCTTDNTKVRISVQYQENLPDAFGDSFVGPQIAAGGREYGRIRLSPASFDAWQINVGSFGILDLASVCAHELGHAIGFYHEHDNPASGACANGANYNDGTHEALTQYDPASIMHYRSIQRSGCTSSTYVWLTKDDRDGARIAYPPTPKTPAPQPQCLKGSYGRGVGTPLTACGAGQEQNGALCYPTCAPGYYGVGPVCWQSCPSGYADDGVTCRRDASIISADNGACPWYDKCGLTFAQGCSSCPAGYTNDGCTCRIDASIFAKSTYGRGAGTPMTCPAGQEQDAGLCYTPCTSGYTGVGPVCWEQC